MDKELTALLERFKCADGCDELSVAELGTVKERLTAWQTDLEEAADEANLEKIGKLEILIASVDEKVAEVKAEFAAKADAIKGKAKADFAAEVDDDAADEADEDVSSDDEVADADEEFDLSDFTPERPVVNADEGKNIAGKVMVATATKEDGTKVFDGEVKTSLDLTKALARATEKYGRAEGRIPVVAGVYDNASFQVIDGGDDDYMATVKMLKAVDEFKARQDAWLTADGSFCAPVTPDYSFCDLSDTDLDLFQASLPSVRTIRGRVQYMLTPTNDQFFDGWGGVDDDSFDGVGTLFTEADSIAVDGSNEATWKQCVEVDCPDQGPVAELEAHYTCVEWKHFTWKAYPEYIDLYTRKSLQAHMLKESLHLLQTVQGLAETPGYNIESFPGSVTGFFSALDVHTSAYRDAFWLPRDLVLDIVLPRWVLNMLRAALARRADADEIAALKATDALITSLFTSLNLRVNFVTGWQRLASHTDGAGTPVSPVIPATGANVWPNTFELLLWVPGAVVLLEDPNWNIGIERLRDTRLQRQNKYSLFTETFYGIGQPCPYPVQQLTVEFCPTGASSARETLNCANLTDPSPAASV